MSRESTSSLSKPKVMQAIESFDQLRQGFLKSDTIIQGFINSQPEKNKKTEIFKVLVSIYDLFKSELNEGLQMREFVLQQKQEIKSLKSDLSSFCNLFTQYSGAEINSLKDAKDFVFSNQRTELTSKELRETQTELTNERQKSSKLVLENQAIQQRMKELADTIKSLEENTERVTNKLRMGLKKEKANNESLVQEIEFIKQENKAFLYKLCEVEHIQSTENKDDIIRFLIMKNHGNCKYHESESPKSIRALMIISMFSIRIRSNVSNPTRLSVLQKEITKAKIKAAQIGNW